MYRYYTNGVCSKSILLNLEEDVLLDVVFEGGCEGSLIALKHFVEGKHIDEIIDELETVRRGLYGGATGYLAFDGNMNFCITIRTMIKKGDKVYLQAGAGIVADSVPENEYQECCNKVMALAKTLVEEENL